ncbi:hypothetical protein ADT71_16715 [Novosphingobium sp. ST904]|nr:hypothetical protein ADT71_16715 [Novosphingobium sp. ST904]
MEWAVSLHGLILEAFANQRDALNRAVDAAHQAGMNGHRAQVLLVEAPSDARTHWVFGHHPYPPTA